jgi:hypothetical protein
MKMNSPSKPARFSRTQMVGMGIAILIVIVILILATRLNTPAQIRVTFDRGASLRQGPSAKFSPPIGKYPLGESADIVAKNLAGDWYKITGAHGEGWVSAQDVAVPGDIAQIPVEVGPPTPSRVPASPAPAQPAANLVLGNVSIEPALPLKCGIPTAFKIDIANLGAKASEHSGTVMIQDYWNDQEQASTTGTFPIIEAGKIVTIEDIFLTVVTHPDEDHKLVITVNPDGFVPEANSSDNYREFVYRLQSC